LAERAYPEDLAYVNKGKYYDAFIGRYSFGRKYTQEMTVLDVPCGCGWGTSLIDNAKEVYGIDISSDAINYAYSHFDAHFLEGTMCNMPFKKDKFDVALCFEGIEHISKEEGVLFLNEIKRVVKEDGLIIGSVPILDENGKDTGNPYHKFEYPEAYLRLLLEYNFEIIAYDIKQGGDGPIVYFILKNRLKNLRTIFGSSQHNHKTMDCCLGDDTEYVVINDDEKKYDQIKVRSNPKVKVRHLRYDFNKKTNPQLDFSLLLQNKVSGFKSKLLDLLR